MGLVTGIVLPNNGDRIKVENYNDPLTKILAAINGGLDSANITTGTLPWEVMAPFTNKITASAMQDSGNLEKWRNEAKLSFITSGLIWSALSGLNGAMTTGTYYNSSGVRAVIAAIASRAFTASRDTYVYIDNTNSIGYSEVTNNATAPALPANSTWVAVVITSASAITSIRQVGTAGTVGRVIYPTNSLTAANEGWIAPTLAGTWVNFDAVPGFAQAAYMKDSLGFVHIKGLVKSGTVPSTIFTLPAGYRPMNNLYISSTNNAAIAVVRVQAVGDVVADTGGNTAFSINNIHFKAEQ